MVRACLGTMNEYVPWAVAAALLLALLITVLVGRRRRTAAGAAAEQAAKEASEEHQRTITERDRSHEAALKALTRARDAERDLSRTELETAQEEAEQTRDALARTWSSEAVSHTLVREACVSAGLSGVLATNVVFVPVDARTTRRFLAQIDHLLLTRHGALIIEAKYWQGSSSTACDPVPSTRPTAFSSTRTPCPRPSRFRSHRGRRRGGRCAPTSSSTSPPGRSGSRPRGSRSTWPCTDCRRRGSRRPCSTATPT
ncbi:hypothetical protein C5C59_05825 [Rathayibacter sp. AY1F4]|nr:hypothetical protein C5C26_13670 [Rathayibacter sp. AY2B1]PPG72680.1 hypothetical protein C5C59_05825 [Rathayibacter sp. AY1F4]